MKTKVGELYNKPIVIGNPNEVNKDEILLKNDVGGITLSERKDGELKDITNITPRCFILNKREVVCSQAIIQQGYNNVEGALYANQYYIVMFGDSNSMLDKDENFCNIDTWIEINKENIHKEISYEDFLGNKVDGYFSKIRLDHPGFISDIEVESSYFIDSFSKQRINYLKNNLEKAKYNLIALTSINTEAYDYAYITDATIVTENNKEYIIFNIEPIPPYGETKRIKINLNAEVVK